MNFLIFIFSHIDIQPEYNLLSFILSAQSKLNIGPVLLVKHQQHFYPVWKTFTNQALADWTIGFGQNCLVISFQWPSKQPMFALHERSVNISARGWIWLVSESLKVLEILLHIDLQWWGHGKVGRTDCNFIFNVKYSWFRQEASEKRKDHYFYHIIPRSESPQQWFSVHQYVLLYFP